MASPAWIGGGSEVVHGPEEQECRVLAGPALSGQVE
jgi:hypothetical protein